MYQYKISSPVLVLMIYPLKRMSKEATTWPPNKPGRKPFYIPANTRFVPTNLVFHSKQSYYFFFREKDWIYSFCNASTIGSLGTRWLVFFFFFRSFANRSCFWWDLIALEFDPDRFLDERLQKYLILNPFIFLPFNAGPRICLGQQVKLSLKPLNLVTKKKLTNLFFFPSQQW